MTVRRLIVIPAIALLCGCMFVAAGCGSTDTAATTVTSVTATALTTETARLYRVYVDGKWGYIDNTGTIKIEPVFDQAWDFSEGLAAVDVFEDNGPRFGYIDTSGDMVIEPRFYAVFPFSESLAAVVLLEKYAEANDFETHGYVDKNGAVVIPVQYSEASSFSGGIARVVFRDAQSGSPTYIDKTGKVIWQGK